MSFFSNLFKKNEISQENIKLHQIEDFFHVLLNKDYYISKKEYSNFVKDYSEFIDNIMTIKENGLFKEYCKKNKLDIDLTSKIIDNFKNIDSIVENQNNKYINKKLKDEKEYLDNILKKVDPVINLDLDQRKVVLSDEDYTLVIAGAGAGKTTTVAAKVKYLVEKRNIDPKQILVISFTNKAVGELREKINDNLKIDCPIATFHSTGNAIIHKTSPEKLNIVEESKMYFVLQDYFSSSVLQDESMVNNLINFFAGYFDAPYEGDDINDFFNKIAKSNYSTLKSDLDEFEQEIIDKQKKKKLTIQNELVRSYEEVEIANFLYLNGIEYQYEPLYKYSIQGSTKPYTPDFLISQNNKECYIEHFGISEDGKNNRYDEDELNFYKKAVNDKIIHHKKHNTNLIYTFSSYNDGKDLLVHLKNELLNNGFDLYPRNKREVLEKIIQDESNRYTRRLVSLITRFISAFKINNFKLDDFDRMDSSTQNVRTKLFLKISKQCYLEYERYLKENNLRDFSDLINESAKVLKEVKDLKQKLDFKYVIVDEYQDISMQRYDLVTALSEVTNAKIIAVGDDWQSIYAFSGSNIELFTNFEQKVGYALKQKIVNTYRNSQEVIDIAGGFIQKNDKQIKKELKSPKNIDTPVMILTYDGTYKKPGEDNRSGANYHQARAVQEAIECILKYNKVEQKETKSILLLGRFGFDGEHLAWTGLFQMDKSKSKMRCVKHPELDITFMTAHASKGLGYDNVIIINGKNETYGFPSKIEDDPVLKLVLKTDRSIEYAEERRLFYVAMTRTKNRVFIVAPQQNPSEFLIEIKKDFNKVKLVGEWDESYKPKISKKKPCPICGYPLIYKYKNAFGLRLYICSNEPEICGFMTNDLYGGKLSILKCDSCSDGYLIVKKSNTNSLAFLGCTNYKNNGSGCNNTIGKEEYYKEFGLPKDSLIIDAQEKEDNNNVGKKEQKFIDDTPTFTVEDNEDIKDIYLPNYNEYCLNHIVIIILSCIADVSKKRFYGVLLIASTLHGDFNERISRNKLDTSKYYGSLKNLRKEEILRIINWLIDKGFINQTKHQYPVISIGYKGTEYKEKMTRTLLLELRRELR